MNNLDLIGDIHGHADELEALLKKMGYAKSNGVYSHSERKALFVGDYIDRGPKIRETLQIVRPMVEHSHAFALMGNHEYNALCFHHEEKEGGHLRKHEIKNILQHYETLLQFKNRQEEYDDYLDWFKTLPLFIETESFRAVHACWDSKQIRFLKQHLVEDKLTDALLQESVIKENSLYSAIEDTLKGKEIQLPKGQSIKDKDGFMRSEIRIKWWEDPKNSTYRSLSVIPTDEIPESAIDPNTIPTMEHYQEKEKPVFFGHYWLKGQPCLFRNNICCLDFSVAKKGHLAAYRFEGESKLTNSKFIYV